MTAPESIINLVNKFHENEHQYTNPQIFDEENTKQEFITPFFEALGWDVYNNQGYSPQYKEVVMEDTIKVKDKHKSPDYSFRLGGQKVFLVEAKKPSRNIYEDKDHALQLRRYGWNAGLPLCILTDFQELAVYDTSIMPENNQGASIGRVKYYKYTDYITRWDEIRDIFSKDAVLTGKFDKYAHNVNGGKHGTTRVDDKFLEEIEGWRLLLARNIALRNPELSIEELNLAVQLTIDRIIFLRIAEGRGIEREGRLQNLLKKNNIYKEFTKICREADQKYNSGLFHFTQEENNDLTVDTYTLDLTIDDKVFGEIFKNLYYPYSPYEFSMISTEILGKIYEQFLGKVIRLTPSHQAKVEDKPEVKKAGGVYYTPQYIVDYIVEHTLGEKIKGLTPKQISKVRIIDPACGSGSFLIRAYQYLLDYHLEYYSRLEKPPRDTVYVDKNGVTCLTINEKKRILRNNIYGVDIDTLAVEVTKLSLLLKVLEDQHKDQLEAQQKLFHERALPNLSSNIKNGNSLIGSDILEQQELSMEEIKVIKPFDYEEEFPEIFEQGGFDCVIGNPPYVNIENINSISKEYYMSNYTTFEKRTDLFVAFLERSLNIMREYSSFIIPSIILSNTSYKKFRNLILNNSYLKELCYVGYNVFAGVTVDTIIINMNKEKNDKIKLLDALDFKNKKENIVKNDYFKKYGNVLSIDDENTSKILEKIFVPKYETVKDNFKVFQGIVTGNNEAFIFESEEDAVSKEIDVELLHPMVYGKNISRWEVNDSSNRILYVDKNTDMKKYPNTLTWLKQFKPQLKKRRECKQGKLPWYSLQWPRVKEELDTQEKLFLQRTRNERLKIRTVATIDSDSIYCMESLYCLIPKTDEYSLYFLLSIINSNLINYLFATKFLNLGIKRDYINMISYPKLNQKEQKPFIELSQKMLKLHKTLQKTNTPTERKLIQKQIELTDKKINEKVYELYDLTEEEIRIVEESVVTEN